MLRLFSSSSRRLISVYPSASNAFLNSTRSASNHRKFAESDSSSREVQSTSRRLPSSSDRKLNVKKLFSDDNTEEMPLPSSPRRPNILHSSTFDDPTQMASNLSTKTRYENEIAEIDDYQQEEQRRRSARQAETKASNENAQSKSKRTPSKKKFGNALTIEKLFDESEYISTERSEKKSDYASRSEQNQQPRKPRRERVPVEESDEVGLSSQKYLISLVVSTSSLLRRSKPRVSQRLQCFWPTSNRRTRPRIY